MHNVYTKPTYWCICSIKLFDLEFLPIKPISERTSLWWIGNNYSGASLSANYTPLCDRAVGQPLPAIFTSTGEQLLKMGLCFYPDWCRHWCLIRMIWYDLKVQNSATSMTTRHGCVSDASKVTWLALLHFILIKLHNLVTLKILFRDRMMKYRISL